MRLGDRAHKPRPSIATGFPSLDYYVFGCGGIPRGAVVEIIGPESSGKTTAALTFVAAEQKQGGLCAFVDAEHAIDIKYAHTLGVDVDKLFINQPDSGEQALEVVIELIKSKAVTLIVVDSVAALVPAAELAGDMTDQVVGLQARMMSKAMRMLVGIAQQNQVTVIFINQIREKIGVMYGNPETTPGGRALKFYSTVRLDVRRESEGIRIGTDLIGHTLKLKAIKNKAGVPLRETKLDLYYVNGPGEPGLDRVGDLIEYAIIREVLVDGSGKGHYELDGERLAHGKDNLKEFLKAEPKILDKVKNKLAKLKNEETKKEI